MSLGYLLGMRVQLGILALAVIFAVPAHANRIARVRVKATSFVPAFLGSMSLSLQQQEFYASKLLNAFYSQVSSIEILPNPESVVEALQAGIEDGKSMIVRAKELGQGLVPAERAAAILVANALSRPEQFDVRRYKPSGRLRQSRT